MKQLFSFFLLFVLCASIAFGAHTNFKATLNGIQEVPPVTTTASGTGAFTMTNAGGLLYTITVNGLSGAITAAHFHLGAAGTAGPVIQAITFSGTTAVGTWAPLADSIVAALYAGRIYVNVHTAANPGGEIRGQVVLSSGTALSASLEGAQEVPGVTTTAKGTATLSLASVGGQGLAYSITVSGLSGAITGAHFHRGALGATGPVIRDITGDFVGNTARGVWRTTGAGALADSDVVRLLTGGLYLNVHTATNPGGEIRGQINVSDGIGLGAKIDSLGEVPPTTSTAKGTGSFVLTEYGLVYSITVTGLTGAITGAHFHNGGIGSNGPVVRTLTFANNTSIGVWKSNDAEPLNAALLRALLADSIYVNIHTAANPGGEIRGQVIAKAGSGATARYTGLAEVPPVTTTASATASLVATPTGLNYEITVNGLSGPITGAHFHQAGIGVNGPVVRDITSTFAGNRAIGTWGASDVTQPFTEALRAALVAGQIYLNIHTSANPAGEVRGQCLIDAGAGYRASLTSQQENPPLTNAATGTGTFTLTRGGLGYKISLNGSLSGTPTGAHFHLGYAGENGPVMLDILPTLSGNTFTGYWRPLPDSIIPALMTGRIYVNVHTAANPGGEIRGQVLPSEGTGLWARLSGTQEVPPNASTALGTGVTTLTDAGLTYHVTFSGLSAAMTAAHFHNAPAGANGGVVRTITSSFTGTTAIGAWRRNDTEALTATLMREILSNNTYLNVHNATFPGGEIRGQVRIGSIVVTSVSPVSSSIPAEFNISQNYPNPFNPSTTIRVDVPQASKVNITVFNILGREVATIVNEELKPGEYELKWDATDVASGTYFYKITAGKFVQTRKMILLK
jgi:Cu/Zn superoxide dismutase